MEDLGSGLRGLRRPHPNLLIYWTLESLLLGPFFVFLLVPRFLRYRTLRYEFDDDGVTARWGVLFRREFTLTYGRIQDIHLASNLVERWLGLGRVQVQTAAGSSKAELTVTGLQDYARVRDFLYSRMRGAREPVRPSAQPDEVSADAVAAALREAAAELRAMRLSLSAARSEDVS